MTIKVVGRSYRNTKRNVANNDFIVKTSNYKRTGYLPSVPGPIVTDSNFKDTVLLLHGDSVSGANNTMFIDSSESTNFIPFPGTYSNYFNGSTDYFTIPYNSNFNFGVGTALSFEAWVYPVSYTNPIILANRNWAYGGTGPTWGLSISSATDIRWNIAGTGSATYILLSNVSLTAPYNIPLNTWTHVAFTRDSAGNNKIFVNGYLVAARLDTQALTSASGDVYIGRTSGGSTPYSQCYMSNMRLVTGSIPTLYQTSSTTVGAQIFTPPTTPLTAVSGTQLLTCQSSQFKDNSTNNFAITTTGTPAISSGGTAIYIGGGKPAQGTFSPFSLPEKGYSTFFNGSSDYLQFPRAAGTITTGPFTIEGWVNITAHKTNNMFISNQYWSIGQNGGWGVYINSSGNVTFGASSQTFNVFPDILSTSSTGTVLAVNRWYHLAVVRDSNDYINIYVDGVASATPTLYSASLDRNTGGTQTNWLLNIGINNADGTNYNYISGHVSNARIVNGTAVYTGNFIPPTEPLTAIPGTIWLASQNKTNFNDNSINNYAVTVGGAPQRRAVSPFKTNSYAANTTGGSIYFNGSSDFLTVPSGTFVFGSSDFTIEAWIYTSAYNTSGNGGEVILDNWIGANPNYVAPQWQLWITSTGTIEFQNAINATVTNKATSTAVVPLNTWNHVAAVRSGQTITVYLNGVSVASRTGVDTGIGAAGTSSIGKQSSGNPYYFTGYIGNVKVTNGKALYTTTFNPPTAPATPTDAPVLLLNATNAGIIDQTGKNNLITYGTASSSSTQSKFGGTSMYFNGSSYIATANSGTLYQFGTSNWAVEAWVYPTSTATTQTIYQIYGTTNDNINLQFNGTTLAFFCDVRATNQAALTATSTVLATLNTWNHVLVTRDSATTVKLYVNGQLGSTLTIASTTTFVDTQFAANPTIGAKTNTVTNYFTGYIDELRVTKGVTRYTPASVLLVAGGGGGGGQNGGGGGGGGLIANNFLLAANGTYTVTVGGGGTGGVGTNNGTNGSNSSIIGYGISNTVIGGGGGGNYGNGSAVAGNNGGSGGGAPGTGSGQGKSAGTGTTGQGTNGGAGVALDGQGAAGGGGGSANTGGAASNSIGGAGGAGTLSYINGTLGYYAGGGGGGGATLGTVSPTTSGGATAAGVTSASNAIAYTGGGGGGVFNAGTAGNGGSGVVVISYTGDPIFTGGVISKYSTNTVHTFNTSGTLSPISTLAASSNYMPPTTAFPDQ
jgi:hypothetical protein